MIPPHVCWTLWKEWNDMLFKEYNQNVIKTWKNYSRVLIENIDPCI